MKLLLKYKKLLSFLQVIWLLALCLLTGDDVHAGDKPGKVPVIVITDLYHPYQDPGDNLDLVMGFALPEVDLKAVILDITDAFRKKTADHPTLWKDPGGPREAGIIPVMQLNYIFDRQVPFAMGPLSLMRSAEDKMLDVPLFEQAGIELLLNTLRQSKVPVEILSLGSARVLAVAYNREPELLRKKIGKIHLSAGTAAPDFQLGKDAGANAIPGGEWNVALDVFAFNRILRSGLNIALYPCAGIDGGFVKDVNNTYWRLPNVDFVKLMEPRLQRYIDFSFSKTLRHDFLKAMDLSEPVSIDTSRYPQPFHFWETALWINVSRRVLVNTPAGYTIIPKQRMKTGDSIISAELIPIEINLREDGRFTFKKAVKPSSLSIYYRSEPVLNEKALQQAYPKLMSSLSIKKNNQ